MDLNYPISNFSGLGKEMKMFSREGYTPTLVIIGRNSRIAYSYEGYITEEDLRIEISNALDSFGVLQQVEKFDNIYLKGTDTISTGSKFVSLPGNAIDLEILSGHDESIVSAQIYGSDMILNEGINTGITQVKIAVSSGGESFADSFSVMVYPDNANIIDFEALENWRDIFYLSGEGTWTESQEDVFHGATGLKTDPFPSPDYENGMNRSVITTEFQTDREDTIFFAYKISSQFDSDGAGFYLNRQWVEFPDKKWSGEVDWSFAQYPVKAGDNTAEWDYFKYEYGSAGKDAAWLDLIRIPGTVTGIESSVKPGNITLVSNYPNPFNGSTVLSYRLERNSEVRLSVYNSTGQKVMEKDPGVEKAGNKSLRITFDGFESGIYFFNLTAGKEIISGKLLYIK
jgi:hypothetical protein